MPQRCPRCGKVISTYLGYCTECKGTGGPRRITDEDKRRQLRAALAAARQPSTKADWQRTYVIDETPGWKNKLRGAGVVMLLVLGVYLVVLAILQLIGLWEVLVLEGVLVIAFVLLVGLNTIVAGVSSIAGENRGHVIVSAIVLMVYAGMGLVTGAILEGLVVLIVTVAGAICVLEGWPRSVTIYSVTPPAKHATPRSR